MIEKMKKGCLNLFFDSLNNQLGGIKAFKVIRFIFFINKYDIYFLSI